MVRYVFANHVIFHLNLFRVNLLEQALKLSILTLFFFFFHWVATMILEFMQTKLFFCCCFFFYCCFLPVQRCYSSVYLYHRVEFLRVRCSNSSSSSMQTKRNSVEVVYIFQSAKSVVYIFVCFFSSVHLCREQRNRYTIVELILKYTWQ